MSLNERPILLSLHPEYARLIYQGTKRAELRRRRPAAKLGLVMVYETAPVSRVTGWFRVDRIETAPRNVVWRAYRDHLAISRAEFKRYLSGCLTPTVLTFSARRCFRQGLLLRKAMGLSRPPQSFCYLDPERVARILDR